jgi:hypothetical protein
MTKNDNKSGSNIIDLESVRNKLKQDAIEDLLDSMRDMDFDDFKISVIDSLENILKVLRTHKETIEYGFETIGKGSEKIFDDLKFLKHMVFMNMLNQSKEKGEATEEYIEKLAKSFDVDLQQFMKGGNPFKE